MELIDSKYTREKYKDLGIEFDDWQKAAIIWNKPMTLPESLAALKEFADKTSDSKLKKQIEERVSYEEKCLAYIKQNPNNDYVYIVRDVKNGSNYGAFYIFDVALMHARKCAKEYEEKIHIYKVQIVKGNEIPKCKSYTSWNPIIFPDKPEIEEYCYDYDDGEVGQVTLALDGAIQYWWSSESTLEEDQVVENFDKNRFENRFIKLPYVHKAGMIVRYTPTGELGVLATGKDDWNKFMQRVENGLYVDYMDASHEVYSLSDKGYWMHDHISPFLLEEANIPDDVTDEKDVAMYQAMKTLSAFFAGNQTREQEVIRTAKEYSRVVYEQKMNGGDKNDPTDIWSILR